MSDLPWKALAAGSALVAGLVATKLADEVWKTIGQEKLDPDDPDTPIWPAVAYAALTGLAVGAAKAYATHRAAAYYAKSAGHPPHH